MKTTKYILWATALILLLGCERLSVLEDDGSYTYYSPFSNSSVTDDAKHPVAVFSDRAIICDIYHRYDNFYKVDVDGLQVSTTRDFHSIEKEYSSEALTELANGSNKSFYYWTVDDLTPKTTYYYRYFSVDTLGGGGYSDTLSFTTNGIKLSELAEVTEVSPTFARVRVNLDDVVTSVDNEIIVSFSVIQGNDTLRLSGRRVEGTNILEADFPWLTPNTAYVLMSEIMIGGMLPYSSYSFELYYYLLKLPTSSKTFATPAYKTADFVDLGLGIKWATCNLGATKPEQTGGYYTYPQATQSVAGTSSDIVTNALGPGYRMPTQSELQLLCDYCSWKEETVNGIKGMRCTGPNDNSIFFPYSGYIEASHVSDYYTNQSTGYYSTGYYGNSLTYSMYGRTPREKGTGFSLNSGSYNNGYSSHYYYMYGSGGHVQVSTDNYNKAMPIRPVSTITY